MKKIVLLISLIVPLFACAANFTVGPVTIEVPDGFEGPVHQELQGSVVAGFTKRGTSTINTLLQITVYKPGPQLKLTNTAEYEAAASKYLLDFVGGVERRRTDFKRTELTPLKIFGVPAAKLQWTGKLQGLETVGIMYSIVVGSSVISLHTQDAGSVPTAAMCEASAAFESVRIKDLN